MNQNYFAESNPKPDLSHFLEALGTFRVLGRFRGLGGRFSRGLWRFRGLGRFRSLGSFRSLPAFFIVVLESLRWSRSG